AQLSPIPLSDSVVRMYLRGSSAWETVTPVVLPGFDDPGHLRRRLREAVSPQTQRALLEKLANRMDGLLRKAIRQAGFSEELADHAEIEWRAAGFKPGVDRADRYALPQHLRRFPCTHVRLTWVDRHGRNVVIPGPLCLGSGRYYGVGLFA